MRPPSSTTSRCRPEAISGHMCYGPLRCRAAVALLASWSYLSVVEGRLPRFSSEPLPRSVGSIATSSAGLQRFGKKCDDVSPVASEAERIEEQLPINLFQLNTTSVDAGVPRQQEGGEMFLHRPKATLPNPDIPSNTSAGSDTLPNATATKASQSSGMGSDVVLRDTLELQEASAQATIVEEHLSVQNDSVVDFVGSRHLFVRACFAGLLSVLSVFVVGFAVVMAAKASGLVSKGGFQVCEGDMLVTVTSSPAANLSAPPVSSNATGAVIGGSGTEEKGGLYDKVKMLSVSTAADVDRLMLASGEAYDCALFRPISSRTLVRLQGRVERANTAVLSAPFSLRPCVLYSAAVSRPVHDGVPAVPLAYSIGQVDFVVSLLDSPNVIFELCGAEVSLFSIRDGRLSACSPLAQTPEHWQDFVFAHRIATHGAAEAFPSRRRTRLVSESGTLEFQESALLVGAVVTVVGELYRGAHGALSLRPGPDGCGGDYAMESPGLPRSLCADRVLASDDPSLLYLS